MRPGSFPQSRGLRFSAPPNYLSPTHKTTLRFQPLTHFTQMDQEPQSASTILGSAGLDTSLWGSESNSNFADLEPDSLPPVSNGPDASFPQSPSQELPSHPEPWENKIDPSLYNPISKDTISLSIVPEKEGVFMFRYVVYVIEGTIPASLTSKAINNFKVVRRYSDFLWLLECLVKIYPFRLLPVLPPKRLTLDGNYLSSDAYFLERRRRGLCRFVNQLIKHPVLRQEKLVLTFLTVDTDLTSWRKQSSFQLEEEFSKRFISPSFVVQWNEVDEMAKWTLIKRGTDESLNAISQICLLVDRMYKRQEAMSADYYKLSSSFNGLKVSFADIYSQPDTSNGDITNINEGIASVSRYLSTANTLVRDESKALDVGFLEDLKLLRELIGSIKELFARYEKLGGNNIPQLEQRIELNERKLIGLNQKADAKPMDITKVKSAIERDKKSIERQSNRGWLIKECITQEILLCQRTQYQISKLLRDWSIDNMKYAELLSDNWNEMNKDVSQMPII